jgi:hypothetical protein
MMGSTTEVAGGATSASAAATVWCSLLSLQQWLENNNYSGYDVFDGLNATWLRPLTFEVPVLRIVLQQGIRRFPFNLRPWVGIARSQSTKGMGFLARGYIRLHRATGDESWRDKALFAFRWLMNHESAGYQGSCWGNHFDYQSRSCYVQRNTPSVVWTALIGHAFLDGYEQLGDQWLLDVANSACTHIERDLGAIPQGENVCINYFPTTTHHVHNANTLGASLLARNASFNKSAKHREMALKALRYTAAHQRPDGSWYYGEAGNLRWIDNFHTGYVLDSFNHYGAATGDMEFDAIMMRGYKYWKQTFFLSDGTPRYYDHKTEPIDIQCSAQAIDTLLAFRRRDPDSIRLATLVALWTLANMRDRSGYFYYRRYAGGVVNKTPTLHWGQSTMLSALAALYEALQS